MSKFALAILNAVILVVVVNHAYSQTNTQPPLINQGPGSAFSYEQQGGITAGTVIINGERYLDVGPPTIDDIKSKIPVGSKITVATKPDDPPPGALKNKLEKMLSEAGYDVQRVTAIQAMTYFKGLDIHKSNEGDYVITFGDIRAP